MNLAKSILAFVCLYVFNHLPLIAQGNISTLQQEKTKYAGYQFTNDLQWDSLRFAETGHQFYTTSKSRQICTLNKRVFGWHPYWMGSVYQNYQWNLISDFCYFDYDVSPTTGQNVNPSFAWSTSQAVSDAITNGVRTHICATLFGSHSTFFASSSAQQTFITNIINLLNSRGGNGVNIDFEGMGSSHTAGFTSFMQNLSIQVKAANPNYEISMALYAVDWSNVFDIANLNTWVDTYIIMGYDYYYSGSTTAGPEAPLYNFQTSYNYTLPKSITYYLNKGVPNQKLLLGLPYYGREWETTLSTAPSSTTGNFTSSRTFNYVKTNAGGDYSTSNYHWEPNCFNPYYAFQVGGAWRQCWIDDARSMRKKFDLVNMRGIGGIGIWALGYDDGYNDYWDAIQDKFSNCAIVPCSDTIYDMGGPNRNYYDNENYTFTIAPDNAAQVQLNFNSFATELNYDTLFIYDGTNINAPLIGKYHGTSGPGIILSSGNALTLKFKTDNGTTNTGFMAVWNCLQDIVAPTTSIQTFPNWITQNFSCSFTDIDNTGGSGLEKSFYSVQENNGSEYLANEANGFFNDDFSALNTIWTNNAGTWVSNGNELIQNDQSNSNTNLSASLTQNLSNRYLYHMKLSINGTGTNRRAGLHIFADNPALPNRGNNYLVWLRADQDKIEIYKVTNDVLNLVTSFNKNIQTNVYYDLKIIYDRITGNLQTYINDSLSAYWTDSQPLLNGNYISVRNGNCLLNCDLLQVFRSRNASVNISVGAASNNDLRFQNANPTSFAGRIRSIVKDSAHLLSQIQDEYLKIDWSAPLHSGTFNDGALQDIDTTYTSNQLEANWIAANDAHSGINYYEISIGTTAGAQDILSWTNISNVINHLQSGLNLLSNQIYYWNLRATNGAGITSNAISTDGVRYVNPLGVSETAIQIEKVFPNPFTDNLYLTGKNVSNLKISVFDEAGRNIPVQTKQESGKIEIRFLNNISKGVYYMITQKGENRTLLKIVKD